jgi:hypothetical protein
LHQLAFYCFCFTPPVIKVPLYGLDHPFSSAEPAPAKANIPLFRWLFKLVLFQIQVAAGTLRGPYNKPIHGGLADTGGVLLFTHGCQTPLCLKNRLF